MYISHTSNTRMGIVNFKQHSVVKKLSLYSWISVNLSSFLCSVVCFLISVQEMLRSRVIYFNFIWFFSERDGHVIWKQATQGIFWLKNLWPIKSPFLSKRRLKNLDFPRRKWSWYWQVLLITLVHIWCNCLCRSAICHFWQDHLPLILDKELWRQFSLTAFTAMPLWISDLARSVTPIFLLIDRFLYHFFMLCEK